MNKEVSWWIKDVYRIVLVYGYSPRYIGVRNGDVVLSHFIDKMPGAITLQEYMNGLQK